MMFGCCHTIKNKQKLILRSKRIRGQFEALERVLDEGRDCSEVLQIISAARGAVNSLMTELLEGHIGAGTAMAFMQDMASRISNRIQLTTDGHFFHYNFCRVHKTLRVTPAMEAGLTDHVWTLEELVGLVPEKKANAKADKAMVLKALTKRA